MIFHHNRGIGKRFALQYAGFNLLFCVILINGMAHKQSRNKLVTKCFCAIYDRKISN